MEKTLPSKTLAPLWILQILQKHSDYNHKLTQEDIIKMLKSEHSLEIERKTVSRNIANLVAAGYDIVDTRRGYYINSNSFDNSELQLLIDSVLFSRHISNNYAKNLIDKLIELGGPSLTTSVKNATRINDIDRETNKELFLNIELVSTAMLEHCKMSFVYYAYDFNKKLCPMWDEPIIVSPLRLVVAHGYYYLIAIIDGNDTPTNFRLDKLTNATIVNEPIPLSESSLLNDDNLDKYLRSHPLMYFGNSQNIKLKADKIIFNDIIDTFGKDFTVVDQDEYSATITLLANESEIVEWALQNAEFVEILLPQHTRDKIIKNAQILSSKYID